MNPFETETMANLCLRQGHPDEALAIYQRLLQKTPDAETRQRLADRIAAVEQAPAPTSPPAPAAPVADAVPAARNPPLATPGVRARWSGDVLTVEWRLPPSIRAPRLEVLLIKQGSAGVVTETRVIDLGGDAGKLTLTVAGLHLARAAAGYRTGDRFVPVARG